MPVIRYILPFSFSLSCGKVIRAKFDRLYEKFENRENTTGGRMIKNKYKDDYQKTATGRYSYTGKFYTLPFDEKTKEKCAWINLLTAVAFFVLEILAGLLNPDSSRTAWIVFPYFFLLLPTAYMAIGAIAFFGVPLRMERSQYQNSLIRIKRSTLAVLILAVVNLLLDGIYLILHFGEIHLVLEFLYFGCFAAILILGILYGRGYDRMYAGIVIDE
jgi:hypothetical protein